MSIEVRRRPARAWSLPSIAVAAVVAGCAGCSSAGTPAAVGPDGGRSEGDASLAAGDASASADAPSSADATTAGADATTSGAAPVTGKPGCGFALAAFCDTFDAPSSARGRAGELDARWWSGGRLAPQGPTAPGESFGITPATLLPIRTEGDGGARALPACRSGLPAQRLPDQDTLICDPSADIGSPHLLVAAAAQNYGANSYRIRQPFDFAGRTGKIVFDAEALAGGLLGWISVDVTEDPIPVPGFSLGLSAASPYPNDEGTPLPKNGFELQFNGSPVSLLAVFDGYVEKDLTPDPGAATIPTAWGKLNHFEVDVSQTTIEVHASPVSSDGVTFGPTVLVYSASVSLPFTRGYVHITTHNHATAKYTASDSAFRDGFTDLDAWLARWDNVGFDGPVIGGWREYEVADPLTPARFTPYTVAYDGVDTGWRVPDATSGETAALQLHGVDLTGATSARIALASWYCTSCGSPAAPFTLKYRLNGNGWHDRPLDASELGYLTSGASQGALAQMLDVPLAELVPGDNTLEFVSANAPQNYPPGVVDVDLVLGTN